MCSISDSFIPVPLLFQFDSSKETAENNKILLVNNHILHNDSLFDFFYCITVCRYRLNDS